MMPKPPSILCTGMTSFLIKDRTSTFISNQLQLIANRTGVNNIRSNPFTAPQKNRIGNYFCCWQSVAIGRMQTPLKATRYN